MYKNFIIAPNMKDCTHGFFTKKGGVSEGIYKSLNCGLSSNDKKDNILENREKISKALNFDHKKLVIADQTHSSDVEIIDKYEKTLKCDAIISLSNTITLGVLTADCCPVLVAHKKRYLVAVIHLGWKGLYNGIIENFFQKLRPLNIEKNDLIFALGPCIGHNSYQVGIDFKNKFVKKDLETNNFFKKFNNKNFFDLRGYAKKKLTKMGASNIWCSDHDTYKQNDIFFSYRFSFHNKFSDYGRMLSVIKI